jgi:poly(3-hydroxybutyrate) depolymerase
MDKKDGGQAFPHGDPTNGGDIGMTLRDYFAAKALAGWWSSSDSMCALPKDKTLPEFQTEACARFYEWADAMLAARSAS